MPFNLKQRFSPIDETGEQKLSIRYHRAKQVPRDRNIDDWLLELEQTYSDSHKRRMAEAEDTRSV
jgi:hypothetical protein